MSIRGRLLRQAFSLVELLVVVGVIGLLASLLLPAVQRVRESAARIACVNNLRQIGVASHHYHDVNKSLPAPYALRQIADHSDFLTWQVFLLPFIEQEPLWRETLRAYELDRNSSHNPPHTPLSTIIAVYTCPSDARVSSPITDEQGNRAAYGSYLGVAGGTTGDGAMRPYRGVAFMEITDGTSQTLLVGERPPLGRLLVGSWYSFEGDEPSFARLPYMCVSWASDVGSCHGPFHFGPGRLENPCDANHFWSLHAGGANFLFVDGAVRFLSYSAEPIMVALATRAGGETVSVPD